MKSLEPEVSTDDRVGVLVVRVWGEGPFPAGLRARITQTLDLSSGEEVVTTAVDTEAILRAVREWLEAFMSG